MASEVVTPTAARLVTYTRQDDNAPRNPRISACVNPQDEALAKGIVWLDQNTVHAQTDEAGILALLNEELTDYAAHRASAVFHSPADTANAVDPTVVTSIVIAKTRANLLKTALLAHFANTGGTYHDFVDDVNGPLLTPVPNATDVQTLRALVIAIKAYFNAHRTADDSLSNQVHPTNDATNVVAAADPSPTQLFSDDSVEFGGIVEFLGTTTYRGRLVADGSSAAHVRRYLNKGSPGASTSVDISNDIYEFGVPTLPSTVAVTQPTGAPSGIVIECFTFSNAGNPYTFTDATDGTIATFANSALSKSVSFIWNGAKWRVLSFREWSP